MPKRIVEKFHIDEISAVGKPAQKGARAVIMKADSTVDARGHPRDGRVFMTSGGDHDHLLFVGRKELDQGGGQTEPRDRNGHRHPYVIAYEEGENGKRFPTAITLGHAGGHLHTVDLTGAGADDDGDGDEPNPEDGEDDGIEAVEKGKTMIVHDHELETAKSLAGVAFEKFVRARAPGVAKAAADDELAKLDRLAKEHAAKAGVSYAKAYDHVLTNTPEGRELYRAHTADVNAVELLLKAVAGIEVQALDELAKEHAAKAGVSYAKAYDHVLQSPIGAQLYALAMQYRRPAEVAITTKNDGTLGKGLPGSDPCRRLDELAKEYARTAGISYAKAYDHVATQTPEGRELYRQTV